MTAAAAVVVITQMSATVQLATMGVNRLFMNSSRWFGTGVAILPAPTMAPSDAWCKRGDASPPG